MLHELDYPRPPLSRNHRLLRISCILVACLASPTLLLGLLGFGLGAVFSGFEDTYELLINGGTMALVSAALLVLVGLVHRWPGTSKLAIMLTILGMIVGGIPFAFYKFGVPVYGGEFLPYLALAAGMIACGAAGAVLPKPVSTERGFEPIIHRDDR